MGRENFPASSSASGTPRVSVSGRPTAPVAANGQPAVAAYVRAGAGYKMQSLQVFSVTQSGIARNVRYVDPAVFAAFDVPSRLAAERTGSS